jgi:GT2 family glycosyltransferase
MNIAVLLTTYNRKNYTLTCLRSLYHANLPQNWIFDIFITDDNSSDGTVEEVLSFFPKINIEISYSNLYWARGMNNAWKRAINNKNYDAFLLLNDDVVLFENFWFDFFNTHMFCINSNNSEGIYVSSTKDPISEVITYGGLKIKNFLFFIKYLRIIPENKPLSCHLTNANILFIPNSVVNSIGIFDDKFIHGIADYDYTLTANSHKIPIYITPNFGGFCVDDNGKNWLSGSNSLKERISYLKSPKGLAYSEYMYYLKKHFPLYAPIGFLLLWTKTFFPSFWSKLK